MASSSNDEVSDDVTFFNDGRMGWLPDGMLRVDDLCCAACVDGPGPAADDVEKVLVVEVVLEEDGVDVIGCAMWDCGSANALSAWRLLA
jgi:hypothetical protein